MIVPVGPVGFVAWQGIRRRWPTLLLLTLALGLTGAVVLASVAGSRRGREALDEFIEFHHYGNLEAFVDPSLPVDDQVALLQAMIEASGQEHYALRSPVITAVPGPDGVDGPGTDLLVAEAYITDLPRAGVKQSLVIDGRAAARPRRGRRQRDASPAVAGWPSATRSPWPCSAPRTPTASATARTSRRPNRSR